MAEHDTSVLNFLRECRVLVRMGAGMCRCMTLQYEQCLPHWLIRVSAVALSCSNSEAWSCLTIEILYGRLSDILLTCFFVSISRTGKWWCSTGRSEKIDLTQTTVGAKFGTRMGYKMLLLYRFSIYRHPSIGVTSIVAISNDVATTDVFLCPSSLHWCFQDRCFVYGCLLYRCFPLTTISVTSIDVTSVDVTPFL